MTEFFNLLAEPGFEQYQPLALDAPGWIADPSRQTPAVSETHQAHSGANNGVCWPPGYLDCGLYQTITTPATGTYMATFYANADRAGGLVGVNVNGTLASSAGVDRRRPDHRPGRRSGEHHTVRESRDHAAPMASLRTHRT
jgi:hypothetical protein